MMKSKEEESVEEILNSDMEYQEWLSDRIKEDKDQLMQFYSVWETE